MDGNRPPPEKLPEFEEWIEPIPAGALLPAAASGADLMPSGAAAEAALQSIVALKARFEEPPPPAEAEEPAEEEAPRGSPNGARQAAALPDDEDITAID